MMRSGRPRKFDKQNFKIIKMLHAERKKRKIPLKMMNHILSVGSEVVDQWERGNHQPSLKSLLHWCESLGFELTLKRIETTESSLVSSINGEIDSTLQMEES